MQSFDYLIDRIHGATFETAPFRHLMLNDIFSLEHFSAIQAAPEIAVPAADSTRALLLRLYEAGYAPITFPGCFTNEADYLRWLETGAAGGVAETCEGFGFVLRLQRRKSAILEDLDGVFRSDRLRAVLVDKFAIEDSVHVDAGIQKYLTGYEISPHPDIRRKALTWMVNVNPPGGLSQADYHTHFMRFRPEWAFVQSFWAGNRDVERCWVPWGWCETVARQTQNNSMSIFAPGDDTLHAVKADYDHLPHQRTQFYGNLWFDAEPPLKQTSYDDYDISRRAKPATRALIKAALKRFKAHVGV